MDVGCSMYTVTHLEIFIKYELVTVTVCFWTCCRLAQFRPSEKTCFQQKDKKKKFLSKNKKEKKEREKREDTQI